MPRAQRKPNKIRETEAMQITTRLKTVAILGMSVNDAIKDDDYLALKMNIRDLGFTVFAIMQAFERIPRPNESS